MMRYMFGPETRNPETGLPEHFSLGSILQTLAPLAAFIPGVGPLVSAGLGAAGSGLNAMKASKAAKAVAPSAAAPGSGVLTSKDTLKYNKAPREQTAYDIDPFTYGQKGGGKNFFKPYDPMAYSIKAPEAADPVPVDYLTPEYKHGGKAEEFDKDDLTDHLVAYSRGGGHDGEGPVRGIGSGQEDKIPAWLSDGEYVWSAQDVADLGDGSTDEGVRRLDKMRHMVRAQAGRKNVKRIAKPQKGVDHMLKAVGGKV
jgi:hypothetical protein